MKGLLWFGVVAYAYGIAMCFDFNPIGLPIFPGIVAGVGGMVMILAGGSLATKRFR